MVETIQTLSAVLALITAAGAILVVVARLLASRVPTAARLGAQVVAWRTQLTLVIAGGSMLGSLYFSEMEHFIPCRWCWFQRVAMYPIALVALVALIRRDQNARWYMVPMAAIGATISSYHYLLEWKPELESDTCGLFGPACSIVWFREFGFVTLAFMALSAFVAIIVFNTVSFDSVRSPQESS